MVSEFAAARDAKETPPAIVFAYQGATDQFDQFFADLDLDAIAVPDPDGALYTTFGVERGGWREMFGLRSWIAGVRATFQGHRIGRKIGDPWTMPTVISIDDGAFTTVHRGEHAGDHPDPTDLFELIGAS